MKKLLAIIIASILLANSAFFAFAASEDIYIPTNDEEMEAFLDKLNNDDSFIKQIEDGVGSGSDDDNGTDNDADNYDVDDDYTDDEASDNSDDSEELDDSAVEYEDSDDTDNNDDEEEEEYNGEDQSEDDMIYASYKSDRLIGKVQDDDSILFVPQEDAHANANALKDLLEGDEEKVIVLPKQKIEIDQTLRVFSNTTIIAEGATVYETEDKAILLHDCEDANYNSVSNVTIKGGEWLVDKIEKGGKYVNTSIRFMHASNIKIEGVTVRTNYSSHALELIACKNVNVSNSKFLAIGKTVKNSNEEAVQIDIATPSTAPFAAKYGAKFVNGQTCKNITVKNCEIRGSRGISTNKCNVDEKNKSTSKYLGKHHEKITIENCNVTGMTSEAMALHNALNVTVKGCTVNSKDKRLSTTYSIGINIASFGNHKNKAKSKIVVSGNTVNAGRQGIYIGSYKGKQKFASATITGNKVTTKYKYSGKDIKNKRHPDFCAIYVDSTKKVTVKNNKTFTTRGKANSMFFKKCKKVTQKNNTASKK